MGSGGSFKLEIIRQPLNIYYYPKKIIVETKETENFLIKPVCLEYNCEKDYIYYLQRGLAYMRQARLLRITTQAYLQGALLSYPDLVLLLTTSISTLKRDVKVIQAEGILVPVGRILEIEKFLYPARALDLYFQGVSLSSLLEKTFMTEKEFEKVLEEFKTFLKSRGAKKAINLKDVKNPQATLLSHFYRVYQRYRGSEILNRLEKVKFDLEAKPRQKNFLVSLDSRKT